MSTVVTSAATKDSVTAKDHAAMIAEHFRLYNEEFGRITRRAALNFLAEDWRTAQLDAVARIELYELRVARAVAAIASQLQSKRTDVALWIDIKRAYEIIVARRPDSDFYRTFFNSVTRDLFGTVGVNPEVEFCATNVGRASGAVPIRVYRIGKSLPAAVREILASAPGVKLVDDPEKNYFPMPKDASGQDPILVGRIRQDLSDPSGHSVAMFVAGDQLLKGAALNAVQIAEQLL